MSAEKLSPRQQMIGIMYLVLLAMLAMNASKDLLDAFLKLESGIDLTAKNFTDNVQPVYDKIGSAAATNSSVAQIANQKAIAIKKETQEVFNLIAEHKKWLIDNTDGLDDNGIPKAKDNQDIAAEYFLVKGHGKTLREKITHLKSTMAGSIDPKDKAIIQSINALLATDEFKDYEDNKMSWEAGISEHLPLAAVTANLSNLQSYLRNAESIAINYLYENIGIDNYKVNKIQAATIAENSYVLRGEEYQAKIFLAASDTTQQPIILVGEYDEALFAKSGQIKWLSKVDTLNIKDGFGSYKRTENSVGEHEWKGLVRIPHPNPKKKGEFLTYPFENKFLVAQPSAVVSADKMNAMYLGPENPVSISVPGISSDKLKPVIDNGTLVSSGNGKFIAKPSRLGTAKITVYAEINGERMNMGQMDFRVKSLPLPIGMYMNKSGKITMTPSELKGRLETVPGKKVEIKYDPNFLFDLPVTVSSFEIEIFDKTNNMKHSEKISGGAFSSKTLTVLNNIQKGDRIYLQYFKGKDVSGKPVNLDDFILINIK